MRDRLFVRRRRITRSTRALALAMALVAVRQIGQVHADPGDMFVIAAPAIGAEQPKATAISDGDASVSSQTGALAYSYPILVPPGRNGMAPHLSLSYSSQAPIYGTLASGWALSSIPIITRDTAKGRLWSTITTPPLKEYQSSMAGNRPLVYASDPWSGSAPVYRAQGDTSWTRYERMTSGGFWWRAYAPDGTQYFFGDSDHISNCTIVSDEYAPLTRMGDAFGNFVDYFYQAGFSGECRISQITWGQNGSAGVGGILPSFASVTFAYDGTLCNDVPKGAQTSYRTGTKIVTGASKLTSITVTAFPPGVPSSPEHTRLITLAYNAADESCTAAHAAFRSLASIQESAWITGSPHVDLPPVTFTYGQSSLNTGSLVWTRSSSGLPWAGYPGTTYNLGWGYRFPISPWPTVEAMMIDVDGDGLIDRLSNEPIVDAQGKTKCGAAWERNLGPGHATFGPKTHIPLPTLKWQTPTGSPNYSGGDHPSHIDLDNVDEACALNYQLTGYRNSHPSGGGFPCDPINNPACTTGYCTSGANYGDDCGDHYTGGSNTYLAFRWMDVDGDGRVDLVAGLANDGLSSYNLQRGNCIAGDAACSQNAPPPPIEPLIFGDFSAFPCPATSSTINPFDHYTMCGGMHPWFIYTNHGNGVFGKATGEPDSIKYQPMPLETSSGDSSITSRPVGSIQGVVDLDGDGYADGVTSGSPWNVWRNDRTGAFQPATGAVPFGFPAQANDLLTKSDCAVAGACTIINSAGLFDLNSDGYSDHWNTSGGGATASVELSDGTQFLTSGAGLVSTLVRPGNDGLANVTQWLTPAHTFAKRERDV